MTSMLDRHTWLARSQGSRPARRPQTPKTPTRPTSPRRPSCDGSWVGVHGRGYRRRRGFGRSWALRSGPFDQYAGPFDQYAVLVKMRPRAVAEPSPSVLEAGRACWSKAPINWAGQKRRSNAPVHHAGQSRRSNMAVKHGGRTWRSNMAVIHGGQTWRSNMAVKHGGQTWRPDTMFDKSTPHPPKPPPIGPAPGCSAPTRERPAGTPRTSKTPRK